MNNLPPASQIVPASRGVEKTASATEFDPCRGFHASVAEDIDVIFNDDDAAVTITVSAGGCYPYGIKAYTSGTGTLVVLY